MYEQLLFWISAVLAFTLTISNRNKLTSKLIKEKAVIEARLVEAFDRLAEEGANIRKNEEKYIQLELRMKAAEKRFQRILAEEKIKLQLQHQQLESEMLSKQTSQLAALNAERVAERIAMMQETEVRIQTLEEESILRQRDDEDAKNTALKTVHAEILQQVTTRFMDQLKAVEEVKIEFEKERDALVKELARATNALEKEKAEHKQKGPPGAEKKTAEIIRDLQASLAIAGREAQEWRTEAYIAVVRRMPPSPRGVSLFSMDSRNFPLSNQMSVVPNNSLNSHAGIPLGFPVGPSDYPNLAPGLPLPPPNNHANPFSSFSNSQPAPAGLNPDASEFLVTKDISSFPKSQPAPAGLNPDASEFLVTKDISSFPKSQPAPAGLNPDASEFLVIKDTSES